MSKWVSTPKNRKRHREQVAAWRRSNQGMGRCTRCSATAAIGPDGKPMSGCPYHLHQDALRKRKS